MSMTIAILIPTTSGRGRFLAAALSSVERQTTKDWRILLWGDGYSPIIRGPMSIQQHGSEHRMGEASSRNALLRWWREEHADCEFGCWLDDDDIMHPERLTIQGAFLRERPKVDLCFTGLAFFQDGWAEENTLAAGRRLHPPHVAKPDAWIPYDFASLTGNFTGPTAMFRPSVASVPYREVIRTGGCDMVWYYELFMRGLMVGALDDQLYYLRQHPERLTKKRDQLPKAYVAEDLERLYGAVEEIKMAKLSGATA